MKKLSLLNGRFARIGFIVIAILHLSVTDISSQCNRTADSLELVKLYNLTGGPNWTNRKNWLVPGKSIDTWFGITLNTSGCVSYISLNNNNLEGDIYNFNFQNLFYLNLYNNRLKNRIPNFDKLPLLQKLYLGRNQLIGSIPNFDQLKNLEVLELFENELTGLIPNFDKLTKLQSLHLFDNQLSDTIPNFDKLPNLQLLSLRINNLTGSIPNFDKLPKLTLLSLGDNELTGTIPNFNGLHRLQDLDLNNNKITGSIPNFNNLKDLQSLNLGSNYLSDTIPNFDMLPNLKYLYLHINQLIGKIPYFDKSPNILSLQLSRNKLKGSVPNFDKISKLQTLDVSYNQLTGGIPIFEKLSNIINLKFSYNKLGGIIPLLNHCIILKNLEVESNNFTFESLKNLNNPDVNYSYAPQNKFFVDTAILMNQNQNLSLNLGIDRSLSNNNYNWINNTNIAWRMDPKYDIHSNTYTFKSISSNDMGRYTVKVTNPEFPKLILESKDINLKITTGYNDIEIKQERENEFLKNNCYFNPIINQVICPDNFKIHSIAFFDLLGHQMNLTFVYTQTDNIVEIDSTQFSSGIYFIQLQTNLGILTQRILITK